MDDGYPAVSRITDKSIALAEAALAEAAQVLCGLNILVSIPAAVMVVFAHVEIVCLPTGL